MTFIYRKVSSDGNIYFFNIKDDLHNINDLPAEIWTDGSKFWYQYGKIHREGDQPAAIYADGTKIWYKDGNLHRDGDQPAMIFNNGDQYWYKNGKIHRDDDQPAAIFVNGAKFWYKNGKYHRDCDQPAAIYANGDQYWYKNGKLHRDDDKPAKIFANGTQEWWKNGIKYNNYKENDNNISIGYHLREIKFKGKYGTIDKIKEEFDELEEANDQKNNILILNEISDLYGAIKGFLKNKFPNLSMEDIKIMSESTERAFINGVRKSKD